MEILILIVNVDRFYQPAWRRSCINFFHRQYLHLMAKYFFIVINACPSLGTFWSFTRKELFRDRFDSNANYLCSCTFCKVDGLIILVVQKKDLTPAFPISGLSELVGYPGERNVRYRWVSVGVGAVNRWAAVDICRMVASMSTTCQVIYLGGQSASSHQRQARTETDRHKGRQTDKQTDTQTDTPKIHTHARMHTHT